MRRVLHGDAVAAARALLAVAPGARAGLLAELLAEAEVADVYRKQMGRPHPDWGTGSLMSAALGRVCAPEPCLDDPDYAACLAQVFTALATRTSG